MNVQGFVKFIDQLSDTQLLKKGSAPWNAWIVNIEHALLRLLYSGKLYCTCV